MGGRDAGAWWLLGLAGGEEKEKEQDEGNCCTFHANLSLANGRKGNCFLGQLVCPNLEQIEKSSGVWGYDL